MKVRAKSGKENFLENKRPQNKKKNIIEKHTHKQICSSKPLETQNHQQDKNNKKTKK